MAETQPMPDTIHSAAVRKLIETLRGWVRTRYRPGERLPTEASLARSFSRARGTVRKALAVLESEGMIHRKQGSGTYVSERAHRTTGTSGLLYSTTASLMLHRGYTRAIYEGLVEGAAETERHVHLLMGYGDRRTGTIARDLGERMDLTVLDSVICVEIFDHTLLRELARRMVTIAVDFACVQHGVSSCELDHEQNVDLAVGHLWSLGHTRIGFVGDLGYDRPDPAVRERRRACLASIDRYRLRPAAEPVRPCASSAAAIEVIEQWLASDPEDRPTGLICVGFAWEIAQAATLAGIAIPGQLSLVSLADPGPWLSWIDPEGSDIARRDVQLAATDRPTDPMAPRNAPLRNMQITSVALPFREMGRWAMGEVLRRLQRPDEPPQHERFPARIKPGNTAVPPG